MTRETKIGLLVGLGFIVVFAVLLSHTGSVPPPGGSLAPSLAENTPAHRPILSGDIRAEIGQPQVAPAIVEEPRAVGTSPAAEPLQLSVEDRVVHMDDLPDLPAPPVLEPSAPMSVALGDVNRNSASVDMPVSVLGVIRKAPELPEIEVPQPSAPHDPPTKTAAPGTALEVAANTSNKTAPPLSPPKEYVVQSGDSLVRIAQKHYRSSDPRIIETLVKYNEGRIKDADTIRGGQTILIPNLPPEFFERADEFSVRLANGRAVSMEDFMNSRREAPKSTGRENGPLPASARLEAAKPAASTLGKKEEPAAKKEEPAARKEEPAVKTVAAKPVQDSAPRLSLSGLVPVRPSASVAGTDTKATDSSKETKSTKNTPAASPEKDNELYRWYEIKPNDTMGSISMKELGSSKYWPELKKLNNGVDPQKLRPGDRIKLPRKPISSSSGKGRTSA